MSDQEKLELLFNQIQDKLAEGISTILRSIDDRKKRIEALKGMSNVPTIDILKRINKIAIEKEDYETCEAIKEYSNERGLTI